MLQPSLDVRVCWLYAGCVANSPASSTVLVIILVAATFQSAASLGHELHLCTQLLWHAPEPQTPGSPLVPRHAGRPEVVTLLL